MSNNREQNRANANQSEQQTMAEQQPATRQPILTAPEPVDVRRSPAPPPPEPKPQETPKQQQEANDSNLSEFIKFGILAVILLGTPLVISLLIPVIFGQIVPAVLGSDLPGNTQTIPGDQIIQPPSAETAYPSPIDPQTGIGGEEGEEEPTPTPFTTVDPEATFHIVRSGDTLFSIAQQYGLTAADIAAANNLANENQIFSGQVLVLPPSSSPQ